MLRREDGDIDDLRGATIKWLVMEREDHHHKKKINMEKERGEENGEKVFKEGEYNLNSLLCNSERC